MAKYATTILAVICTGFIMAGCTTTKFASETLPYSKPMVKKAALNALSIYDYDVYGITKNRISADEDNDYALFNNRAAPRVHIDLYEREGNATEIKIEFAKKKEILVSTSPNDIEARLMNSIKKYLESHKDEPEAETASTKD